MGNHDNEVTSSDLTAKYNYRTSEIQDAAQALVNNNFANKEDLSDSECKLTLTDKGKQTVRTLNDQRDEVAKAAYGGLSASEQQQLDDLVQKLVKEFSSRKVNFASLSDLMHLN